MIILNKSRMKQIRVLIMLMLITPIALADGIRLGDTVELHYTITLQNGSEIGASKADKPLRLEVGKKQVFPLVDIALINMKVNDEKRVILQPKHAYGAIDPGKIQQVDVSKIPANARKVGATLFAKNAQGQEQRVLVQAVSGDKATLNFNHPLAGQTLLFNMKVLKIEAKK